MDGILSAATKINSAVNAFAWGPFMLLLLFGTGVFLSIKTGFIQVKKFGFMLKKTVGSLFSGKKGESDKNLSPFQAMTTALAGTVGTGNIAGVTGAVFVGGPGAVFWMWVSAFFGMCTKYAEITLAVKYRRVKEDGTNYGGPMYYIEDGLGKHFKPLAVIFACFGGFASFGIGNIAQSGEISGACSSLFGLNPLTTGIILAILVAAVTFGGVKRIGKVTSVIVPFMALFYVISGLAAVVLRINDVPRVFAAIFTEAFSLRSVGGGFFGTVMASAIRQGFARGVFSNEAGLGSAPIAHAASSSSEPSEQALWGIFEVFVTTVIICTLTALTVLLSGITESGAQLFAESSRGVAAAAAFNSILPGSVGGTVIEVSLIFFALSTIIGWSYYGQSCFEYLFHGKKAAIVIYKCVFIALTVVGSVGSGALMWEISDTLNGLMAIPNLIALLLLSGTVAAETKKYFKKNI